MRQHQRDAKTGRRIAVAIASALIATSSPLSSVGVAYADIQQHEAERDAANARADEAGANRAEAAGRAEAAESEASSANANAAATQAELDAANARLDELFEEVQDAYAELSVAVYDLEVVKNEIVELEEQIRQTEADLAVQQDLLGAQVSQAYKSGPATMLDMVLNATTFDDLVTRVLYANKITERFNDNVNTVKDLRARLQEQRAELAVKQAEQEQLVAIQEDKARAAEAAEQAQQEYVNGLSSTLLAALEQARAAEAVAAQARAEEAMFADQEEEARAEAQEQQRMVDEERAEEARRRAEEAAAAAAAAAAASQARSSYVEVAPYVESAASGDQRSIAVNAALSQVGLPYIWGTEAPGVGFDCNSLTHWAWSVAGVNIPYPSGTYMYGQFQWLRASGHWVYNVSDLQPGDLVFYSHNGGASCYHVAMYIGGGQVVHAHSYRLGVTVTDIGAVNGFCGGGSPI